MVVYSLCIVEDDETCARTLTSMIEDSPFADSFSLAVFDGRPALEGYLAAGGAVDVLVTDINLGSDGADGIELVRDLFPDGTKTQVIYVTGYIEYCTPVYETKHTYFIAKPVRRSYLDDALRKSLENLAQVETGAAEPGEDRPGEAQPQSPSIVLKVRGRSIVVACDDIEFPRRPGPTTDMGWGIDPRGLTELLLRLGRARPDLDLMITENGAAFPDTVGADGVVHDDDRVEYLRGHLAAVHAAIAAGARVTGYCVWSLLDNFEWAWGYAKRFGIVHVDYATQKRTPKQSALWFRDSIAALRA